ncbi:MAG: hypothetical protein PHG82_02510 [Candidatus Gracilibacteria bacterium]|nr:hypothetical protein [Candidatus Gracilibacteria bacterium]
MKKVEKNSIENIDDNLFDKRFLFEVFGVSKNDTQIIFMEDLLKLKKNEELEKNIGQKYAIYSNVYSSRDELEIFKNLFDEAIKTAKKIHIVGITLQEELDILEKYYEELGFMREDINCFRVDFSRVLISASVKIENLMWRGSDYKRMGEKIYFIPPIREAGEVKAMFKGINRGSIAGLYLGDMNQEKQDFLNFSLTNEDIIALNLAKVLSYNLKDAGLVGEEKEIILNY